MITSQEIGEIAAAMAKAQAEIKNPTKEKENTFFKNNKGVASKYADLATGLDCIRPALSAQSIAVFQTPTLDRDYNMILRTQLIHSSGQWIESDYFVCKADIDHQKKGSALTYARRQSLFAMVGIAGTEDDDDGNNASANGNSGGFGRTAPITADQAELIRGKLVSGGKDLTKFLAYFKVESIADIRSSQFREAMTLLSAKKSA